MRSSVVKSVVRGDREVIRNLRTMAAIPSRVLDKAGVAALDPMREETVRNARRLRQPGRRPRGGHLDEGVAVRKVEQRSRHNKTFWLAFKGRARAIAHLVEFGTLSHIIAPRRSNVLAFTAKSGDRVVTPNAVRHPGAAAKPFARPAYEREKGGVPIHFGRVIWQAILDAARGMK